MKARLFIFCISSLVLFSSCRTSRSMMKEVAPLRSSLFYELTTPEYLDEVNDTVYLSFIDYSNIDYYTSVKRKKCMFIPLLLYNYESELFHLRLGERSLTQLYREFLTEALLKECNSSTCFHLINNEKDKTIPNSAYRLDIKILKNETQSKIKLNQTSVLWLDGEMLEFNNHKIRPVTSQLTIAARLTKGKDCLLDKQFNVERHWHDSYSYPDSPSANAACLNKMTECLSLATKEIVEEISQELHLVLSLQPKTNQAHVYHYRNHVDGDAHRISTAKQTVVVDTKSHHNANMDIAFPFRH